MKNKKLIITLIIMMLISVVNNYYARFILNSYNNYYLKQLIWYIVGFIIIIVIDKININYLLKYSFWYYLLGIIFLIITLLLGTSINGSRSWIDLKLFSFQPSEFMKIALILYLREFTIKHNYSDFKYLILSFIIVLIPSILTFLEPDTGAIIIYFIIYMVFLFMRKLNKKYYIIGFSLTTILLTSFFLLYFLNKDLFINIFGTSFFYRMDRITNFVSGEGFQIKRALTNLSNIGLLGNKKIIYFPEAPTDFAFTLFISNFGLVGLLIILIIFYSLYNSLIDCNQDKYLLYPLIYILLFQSMINILMNIGLFPIVGITLPLISYGGSSLISFMILIGLSNKKVSNDTYL